MEPENGKEAAGLSAGEKRFLDRLAKKYGKDTRAGWWRSCLIAGACTLALFALARWTPRGWLALIAAQAAGLLLYSRYRKFARFKNRILIKMWREREKTAEGAARE